MLLEQFKNAKQDEIKRLERMEAEGRLPSPSPVRPPSFTAALTRGRAGHLAGAAAGAAGTVGGTVAVIAEYKRRSPSRGVLCETLEPEDVACQYADNGAACLSVLTEEAYFGGELPYVDRMAKALDPAPLPLLRKDFLFHPLQVLATAHTRASALLLIVRLTPAARRLRDLREQAEGYGLEAVVEVFDAEDLAVARESGARIIQVNARDLDSLRVDRAACLALARRCPPLAGECWIAASGMARPEHLHAAADAGYAAALVGSSLMEGGTPGQALAALLRTEGMNHAG